ncbi:dihydroxyacetone kinase phosphoryl donor subunit DhaM [Glycomyces sp. NPDC047010]|uniref:dihydroxyacetone kinase phosphoryl donor subunit DhaM n=1 Tax=Glycomyces sp. NPDC047010 TaxID=3155023 RepID=UPI0033FC3E53
MSSVGIVVVSHSPVLAQAAVDLALEMVPADPPRVVVAAGTADGGTGTDAVRVADAITEVAENGTDVLVFMDLGSAVLSAEMALEFADPDINVRLTSAPFVEGLLAAVVSAGAGATLDEVEREASGALAAKRSHLETPDAPDDRPQAPLADAAQHLDVAIVNTDGLHARPAAQIVAAIGARDAWVTAQNLTQAGTTVALTGPTAVLTMGGRRGEVIRLSADGPDAAAVLADLEALFADGFGEPTGPAAVSVPVVSQPIGVSPGRAAGPVLRMPEPVEEPAATPRLESAERAAAAAAIPVAAEAVAAELRRRAGLAAADARGILEAGAQLATDPGIIADAQRAVADSGVPAARAVWDAFGEPIEGLRARGGRIAERGSDLADARARIVAALEDRPFPGLPGSDKPYVLLARDLAPADTALLDPAKCLALVTEEGGPTSHTAILARALGIPAVVAARGAWAEPGGTALLVDGTTGELTWNPSEALLEDLANTVQTAAFNGRGATADGHPIALLANVGSEGDARAGAAANAEGVGLFRTEFCFLDRDDEPSVEEQIAAYRGVLAAFPGKKVVVRTLDAGSDKPLGFVATEPEGNPALGVRGYRTAAVHADLLDRQLQAIARAAKLESAHVAVMAPMIATVDEAAAFAAQARGHGLTDVGVMIETPAAALLSAHLLAVVDFVSLGTNDLTQYTMAADRLLGSLAPLNDPWQPAVLQLVARAAEAGRAAGKPVGVCGEAAADPLLAAVLTGLGATSLSMAPRALPAVAELLAGVSEAQCRQAALAATAAVNAAEARASAREALH